MKTLRMLCSTGLLLLCLCYNVCAAEGPAFKVSEVTVSGQEETVALPVSIVGNPGITKFDLIVDAGREVIFDCIVADEQTLCDQASFQSQSTRVTWSSSDVLTGDGILFYVRFYTPLSGSYPVTIKLLSVTGETGEELCDTFESFPGSLTVGELERSDFEIIFYTDASRKTAINADAPATAATLQEAIAAVENSKYKVGDVFMLADVSGGESIVVSADVDVTIDLCGHDVDVQNAHAIVNAGTLQLEDSGRNPGLVSSNTESAIHNMGRLTVQGGAYCGKYAILNEGVVSSISGGFFRAEGELFYGSCPLADKMRLAIVVDERSEFYQFWQVQPAPDCTVTFYDEDAVTMLHKVTVSYGAAVTPPPDPHKEENEWFSYEFDGWYTAQIGGERAEFSNVTQSFSVYARYTTAKHVHRYTLSVVAPTCIAQGYTLHQCNCGDSYQDTWTPLIAHTWDEVQMDGVFSCGVCHALRAAIHVDVVQAQPMEPAFVVEASCGLDVEFGGSAVTLYPDALAALARGKGSLLVTTDVGSLELDHAALAELLEIAAGRNVTVGLSFCEPVRSASSDEVEREIRQIQEGGGRVYQLSMICDGQEILENGFQTGLATLRVPFALEPGKALLARSIDRHALSKVVQASFAQGSCTVTVDRPGWVGLTSCDEGTQVGLFERTANVNAGEQVEVDLILQADAGQWLEGASITVWYDADALFFVEARHLPEGLAVTRLPNEGGDDLLLISGDLGQGIELSQTQCVLGTLVFSFDVSGRTGNTAVRVVKAPMLTLSGSAEQVAATRDAELSLWNITVELEAAEHVTMAPRIAYAKYRQAGLYEDAAREHALEDPRPTADEGYVMDDDCWYVPGLEQRVSFSDLQKMAFSQSVRCQAVATPIVYFITYHTKPGQNHPDNPSSYTVESEIELQDAVWAHGKFIMWSDREGQNGRQVSHIRKGSMGDLELWAVWEPFQYPVELPSQIDVLSGVEQGLVCAGQDVVFTANPDAGYRLVHVRYMVNDGRALELTAIDGVYRIEGAMVTGKLTILVEQILDGKVTLLGKDQYRAVPIGHSVLKFTVPKALTSGASVLFASLQQSRAGAICLCDHRPNAGYTRGALVTHHSGCQHADANALLSRRSHRGWDHWRERRRACLFALHRAHGRRSILFRFDPSAA